MVDNVNVSTPFKINNHTVQDLLQLILKVRESYFLRCRTIEIQVTVLFPRRVQLAGEIGR